jgi:FKBP-type peptidyl-prolyl cis-trans isomerase FkpA
MLNLKNLFLFFAVATLVTACKNEKSGKTRNGFDYTFDEKGSGPAVKENDVVFFEAAMYADTTLIQNNNDPENLPAMVFPKNWKEVTPINPFFDILATANKGDKVTLKIPTDSIPPGNPMFQGKKFLVYKLTIKDVLDSVNYMKYMETKEKSRMAALEKQSARLPEVQSLLSKTIGEYKAKTLKTEKTASGLEYFIHEKGTGAVAKTNDLASVDYYGMTYDLKMFDNSFQRGEPYRFPVGQGQVIKGWDEALSILSKGTKATIFVPAALAYGESGSGDIPPNSPLAFYIEIK